MKRLILSLIVVIFFLPGYSQTRDAQISFDEVVHDFGKIKEEDGKVTYRFEFVNTGGSPLLIDTVRATCGCTAPGWTRRPIPPGAKGFVEATYNPAGRPNAFTKYLYVASNSVPSSTKLTIRGEVEAKPRTIEDDFRYSMAGLRLKSNHLAFGNVTTNETKEYRLDVVNNSDQPLKVDFGRIPAHLKVETVPEVLKPKQKGQIVAVYDASKKSDWGMVIDRIDVTLNGESERNRRLIISANISEDFSSLSPEQLANAPAVEVDNPEVNFGKMNQNEKFEHEFLLSNNGKSTLYIRKIKSSCGCTAVQPEKRSIEPGESVKIKTIFNSAGKRGNQNKNVTIITNDPKRTNLILRIRGEVLVS